MAQTCEFCGRSSGLTGSLIMADLGSCNKCGQVYCKDCKSLAFERAGAGDECTNCGKWYAMKGAN